MSENNDVYDLYSGSWKLELSNGSRVLKKIPVKASVNRETGELTLFVDPEKLEKLD